MSQAEQQAYEVLLNEAIQTAQKWEYLARAAMVSLDCIETCIMIDKPDAALREIGNAQRHFRELEDAA